MIRILNTGVAPQISKISTISLKKIGLTYAPNPLIHWKTGIQAQWKKLLPVYRVINRDLMQQDGWKTQDSRRKKKCWARLCIPGLARHFFVILLLSLPAILLRKVSNIGSSGIAKNEYTRKPGLQVYSER